MIRHKQGTAHARGPLFAHLPIPAPRGLAYLEGVQ